MLSRTSSSIICAAGTAGRLGLTSNAGRLSSRAMASSATAPAQRLQLTISPQELAALPEATTKILDVSWHMPNLAVPRDATAEFAAGPRIPRAIRWDLDEVATRKGEDGNELGLGHMMPSGERFREACAARGIRPTDAVILYDTAGTFSSPRGAYTFSAFAHPGGVAVLDGGLPRWRKEMGEERVETGKPKTMQGQGEKYEAAQGLVHGRVVSYSELQSRSADDLVLDARSRERFLGTAPEPRPGLSSGHMPQSISLPFNALLVPASEEQARPYTTYRPVSELKEIFVRAFSSPLAELEPSRPAGLSDAKRQRGERRWAEVMGGKRRVITSCGSGMTACVVLWAMRLAAEKEGAEWDKIQAALYDESWTGYALREGSEIVKGAEDV